MTEEIQLNMEQVVKIIAGLGFKFKSKSELENFISTRTMVQRQGKLITLYIDKIIVGKFTNN